MNKKMRLKFILFVLIIPFVVKAQILKERRVYYLDCSYSMVSNKIWDDVCENLKNAIDKINDETTELIVIPFAMNHDGGLRVLSEMATEPGKSRLKEQISSIKPNRNSMTYHSVPLQDFYMNRVCPTKVTYMFLMTDGQDEHYNKILFPNMLRRWGLKYGAENVYGFYVMLHKSAYNTNIENICNSQKHLWTVETADINVNLIRLQNNAIFNARNDEYFDLPIYGNIDGKIIKTYFENTSPYRVDQTIAENEKLRVHVKFDGDVHSLPVSKVYRLNVSMTGGGVFDFLVTDSIAVRCESKPERSLKISVK